MDSNFDSATGLHRALSNLINLSVPQFPHVENENNNNTYLIEFCPWQIMRSILYSSGGHSDDDGVLMMITCFISSLFALFFSCIFLKYSV